MKENSFAIGVSNGNFYPSCDRFISERFARAFRPKQNHKHVRPSSTNFPASYSTATYGPSPGIQDKLCCNASYSDLLTETYTLTAEETGGIGMKESEPEGKERQ